MAFWRASCAGLKEFRPVVRRFSVDATKFAEDSGTRLKEVGPLLRYIGSSVHEFAENNPKMDDILGFCILGSMLYSVTRK